MIIRADVFVVSVIHPEPARYGAELRKAETFVQMSRMNIAFHDRIELKHLKAEFLSLLQTIRYKLFPYMPASRIR